MYPENRESNCIVVTLKILCNICAGSKLEMVGVKLNNILLFTWLAVTILIMKSLVYFYTFSDLHWLCRFGVSVEYQWFTHGFLLNKP